MPATNVITPSEGGSGAWAELQPGAYRAQVTDIEDVGVSEMFPADGPRLKFTFTLPDELDDDNQPISLYRWCSQKITTGAKPSNLWKWADALGMTPVPGVPFAVAQLIGKECQIVVEMKTPQNGGEPRPNISNVIASPKQHGRRAPLAQRVAASEPADDQVGPCVICGGEGAAFSPSGAALCEAHKMVK